MDFGLIAILLGIIAGCVVNVLVVFPTLEVLLTLKGYQDDIIR